MAGFLRKFRHVVPPSPQHDDDNDDDHVNKNEYSFALEYSGPVLSHDIPRAVPVVVGRIPIAATVVSASFLNGNSVPVVQPVVRSYPVNNKWLKEAKLSSGPTFRHNSSTYSDVPLNGPNVSCESPAPADSSDALGCATVADCRPKSSDRMSSGKLESPDGEDNACGYLDCTIDDKSMPKLSDRIGSSGKLESFHSQDSLNGILDCTIDDKRTTGLFDVVGSSGRVESLDCCDNSCVIVELPDGSHEGADVGFQDYMNPANSESGLSSHSLSSEVFSCKEEDRNNEETPCHARKPSIVTFRYPETSDVVQEESVYSEAESVKIKPKAERPGKKGSCYRCSKGNRFTEKEVCLVCGAKYCRNCVLRQMGSMPEGRKCVTCIGFRIDESKRGTLGKCSRMLKRLLTEMEVKQIMRSEISCIANQLPPEYVFVNGEPLSQEELVILQSCPNPPKKLDPGSYWYDKLSGLWGKDGQKPWQIISPQLNIGGQIMRNASNGKTDVLINSREITKEELFMLQFAGVQCEGRPHFWLSANGSYQEEGQNHIKGRIWDKTGIKLVCVLLSLPTPPDSLNLCGDEGNGSNANCLNQKRLHKVLLVGDKKSGTSTIYKQAKLLFNVPFSEDERQNLKLMIQSNLYHYLGILLEGRERFEEELIEKGKIKVIDQPGPSASTGQIDDKTIYSIGPRLKNFSDWLLKVMVSGNLEIIFPAATREYAPYVVELWKDPAIQATYNRRSELDLFPRVATYFLERAVEISRTDYEPSDMDILYAEGITSFKGLSCMDFSFPKSAQESFIGSPDRNDPLLRYQLIRVHPTNLGEKCKWLEMFEDVDIVLFCVSLTDYDEVIEGNDGVPTNKMLASKQLFESIVTHPIFNRKHFLLILNKYDLLEEKIEQVPLSKCEWFHDFNPVISHNHRHNNRRNNSTPLAQYAFHHIALKFKRLFQSLTGDGKLFVSLVTGLESEHVDEALRYAREIMKWEEEEPNYTNIESSYTDYEASTSS